MRGKMWVSESELPIIRKERRKRQYFPTRLIEGGTGVPVFGLALRRTE